MDEFDNEWLIDQLAKLILIYERSRRKFSKWALRFLALSVVLIVFYIVGWIAPEPFYALAFTSTGTATGLLIADRIMRKERAYEDKLDETQTEA